MSVRGTGALPQAFFLPVPANDEAIGGQRLCLFHPPAQQPHGLRGRVLYLHPFAEELNTSRRVVAQQARALAAAGFAVLQIDLLGCGDSWGDFSDARWRHWLHDAHTALNWLDAHTEPEAPLWLWGLRSGTLLATDIARQMNARSGATPHLLLWQAVASGQQALQQFLRLHAAGQWLQAGAPVSTATPAQALARGEAVSIAGYLLTPALAADLREVRLSPPPIDGSTPPRLVWLHCEPQPVDRLNTATEQQLQRWRDAGWQVQARTVQAPAFWQTVGLDQEPALLQASTDALCGEAAQPDGVTR